MEQGKEVWLHILIVCILPSCFKEGFCWLLFSLVEKMGPLVCRWYLVHRSLLCSIWNRNAGGLGIFLPMPLGSLFPTPDSPPYLTSCSHPPNLALPSDVSLYRGAWFELALLMKWTVKGKLLNQACMKRLPIALFKQTHKKEKLTTWQIQEKSFPPTSFPSVWKTYLQWKQRGKLTAVKANGTMEQRRNFSILPIPLGNAKIIRRSFQTSPDKRLLQKRKTLK